MSRNKRNLPRLLLGGLAVATGLSACGRADHLGRQPSMTNPEQSAEFQAMVAPDAMLTGLPEQNETSASLWTTSQNSLVADRRASTRGDILTVVIEIDDRAEIQNSSGRSRSASDKVSIPALAGLPQRAASVLPEGASMDELVEADSSSTFKGSGNISRRDKMTLRVAATVVEKMPNGVLRIEGSQEVRVNFEVRVLTVSGFVRPSDIGRKNEVAYDRIAGARISYGGRGHINDVQQPRYGQQVADMILPY
ncbi:flagellar basal body L-ring protein FlgH [Paracoccus aestuariivivens]|uniref:Flagellar L-ring protein n=1 Tax=Paracoccus aestuariivivens TaxID=1820333 RepID=A0A6L6JA79_9RHOB|nr:flagellar basal body L-ring protein FlgH [Paracoccus aestuariivivens]MTH78910.1 flagellar basal body L-ring protein FlgH [Paracoccus aestuariivivens]